jgi:hypothetical protein
MNLIKFNKQKIIKISIAFFLIFLLIAGSILFSLSPNNISFPKADHFHFRMQLIIDGKAEDFSLDKYQISYIKGQCGTPLTEEPIHFHDFRDQVVHLHWQNITGGQVLKNYGLNLIGGPNNLMGFRFDRWNKWQPIIPIWYFRSAIPEVKSDAKYWIYTGDKLENGQVEYRKRDMEAFLWADLENFFGRESEIKKQKRIAEQEEKKLNFFNPFSPIKAQAHAGHSEHDDTAKAAENNQQSTDSNKAKPNKEELEKINNLLGNVVIFVQDNEPSKEQVEVRFKKLVDLDNSTCGG